MAQNSPCFFWSCFMAEIARARRWRLSLKNQPFMYRKKMDSAGCGYGAGIDSGRCWTEHMGLENSGK